MKKKKYLPLYYEWAANGRIPTLGLCEFFYRDKIFHLMKPTDINYSELDDQKMPTIFWGKGSWEYHVDEFSPLRQNIVLLMAAMNGEL